MVFLSDTELLHMLAIGSRVSGNGVDRSHYFQSKVGIMRAIIVGMGLILFTTAYAQDRYAEELHAARNHLKKILMTCDIGQQHLNVISNYAVMLAEEELNWYEIHVPDKKKKESFIQWSKSYKAFRKLPCGYEGGTANCFIRNVRSLKFIEKRIADLKKMLQ